jgi:hypothetical protein
LARETRGEQSSSTAGRRRPRGNHSGELAARADQPARARATGVPKRVGSSTCWRGKAGGVGFTVRHPWRTAAARCSRGGGPAGFIAVREAVREVFLRTKGTKSGHGSWHGRSTTRRGGGDVRRVRRRAVGWAARRGYGGTAAHGCEARGAKGEGRNGDSTVHGPAGRRLSRRLDPRGGGRAW